ncbi:hypothetical protein [Shewanella sp. M-Br]|uniref:hypothetical protein n=1 Tax=Shewanella sp. M-Br TaxID=2495595 RepID=UPI00294A481F|nr:hypothetical protein SMBr_18690 [Shewanella sp. M-Br]
MNDFLLALKMTADIFEPFLTFFGDLFDIFTFKHLGIELVSNYMSVVSDTFTLIVGFVAIGIPLAIQIAGQVTEKYDSSLLAKRLTQGAFVNPISLILISTLHIFISIFYKTTFVEGSSKLSLGVGTEVVRLLCFTFFLTMVTAAWFFIRLYIRTLAQTEDYIRDFLMLNKPLFLRWGIKLEVLSKNNSYFTWVQKLDIEGRFYFSRLSASKLRYISAGLEVLIEQLKNKSWDSNFVGILFLFHKKMVKTFFGEKQSITPLSKTDVKFIKLYWDALVRIVRVSREAGDAKLSFHSQRLLATMISHIVHHPQYETLVAESYTSNSDDKINWSSDLYEIARWQGYQSGRGIDLVIECEWFREVFGWSSHVDFILNKTGIITAIQSVVDIFHLIASEHPHKVITLYKNVAENLQGDLHTKYVQYLPQGRDKLWLLDYWRDFNSVRYTINNLDVLKDKVKSLSDGVAYSKYGKFLLSTPLTNEEVILAERAIYSTSLNNDILLRYMKSIGCRMLAGLAFNERWQELYDCLEWKQPRESNACYLGESLFASSVPEVLDLILADYDNIINNYRFHDRYELSPFAFRAFLYQLCYFNGRGAEVGLLYNSGDYNDSLLQKKILSKLLEQEVNVKLVGFSQEVLTSVIGDINSSINAIDERMLRDECNKPIGHSNWFVLKDSIVKGWEEYSDISGLFNMRYETCVLSKDACVLKHKLERKQLMTSDHLEYYGYHFGYDSARNFLNQLYSQFMNIAKKGTFAEIYIDQVVVFSSQESLVSLGFKKGEKNIWVHEKCARSYGYIAKSEEVLVVDNKSVEIKMTLNPLWSEFNSTVFSYFIDNNEVEVELKVEVFYEIALKNDSGVLVI